MTRVGIPEGREWSGPLVVFPVNWVREACFWGPNVVQMIVVRGPSPAMVVTGRKYHGPSVLLGRLPPDWGNGPLLVFPKVWIKHWRQGPPATLMQMTSVSPTGFRYLRRKLTRRKVSKKGGKL